MTRVCSVCQHRDRDQIDAALVNGAPNRRIAAQYTLTEQSVRRHKADHLAAHLVAAQQAKAEAQALDVVRQLKAINGVVWEMVRAARATGDAGTVLKAADRILRQLELQAKLLGDLDDQRPQVAVTLLTDPQWLAVFAAIRGVLVRYPGALDEVDLAVAQIEAAQVSGGGGSVPA